MTQNPSGPRGPQQADVRWIFALSALLTFGFMYATRELPHREAEALMIKIVVRMWVSLFLLVLLLRPLLFLLFYSYRAGYSAFWNIYWRWFAVRYEELFEVLAGGQWHALCEIIRELRKMPRLSRWWRR